MNVKEPLTPGQIVNGPAFNEPMRIETSQRAGPDTWVVGLVGLQSERFRKVLFNYDIPGNPNGRSNALRALLKAEQDRSPDFLRLANALSSLYPKRCEEKRLLDAMLLAVPK